MVTWNIVYQVGMCLVVARGMVSHPLHILYPSYIKGATHVWVCVCMHVCMHVHVCTHVCKRACVPKVCICKLCVIYNAYKYNTHIIPMNKNLNIYNLPWAFRSASNMATLVSCTALRSCIKEFRIGSNHISTGLIICYL